jgi:hypothetical protein
VTSRNVHGDASSPARHSGGSTLVVSDIRDPGDAFIQAEIDSNRRYEWLLIPKALVAFAVVAALIVVRQLFFV